MRSKILVGVALGLFATAGAYDVRADDDKAGKVDLDRKDKVDLDRKDGARLNGDRLNGDVKKDTEKTGQGVIGTVSSSASSKEILGMLEKFEDKLGKMETAANKMDKDARADVLDDIKDMREKVFDTKERARQMERADAKKVTELREDVRKAVRDLEKDYVEAKGSLKGHDKDLF